MSPVAVSLPLPPSIVEKDVVSVVAETPNNQVAPPPGARLVIGSPATAQDESYQQAIVSAGNAADVEKQMIDRILDEAAALSENHYSAITVVLAPQDYASLTGRTPVLLQLLLTALVPRGALTFVNLSSDIFSNLSPQLTITGFVTQPGTSLTLVAQKPSLPSSSSLSSTMTTTSIVTETQGGSPALSMPLPKRAKSDRAAKKQLWTLSSPSTPSIDADALLTVEDRARPVPVCEPPSTGQPRRKKACVGCTCGLAEMESEEAEAEKKLRVLMLNADGDVQEVALSEKDRLANAAKMASKATSSCGSCYLGDAFRCASCPYMGLPAFEPGQKVEIDFGMDDI